jgi:hypothetical protein
MQSALQQTMAAENAAVHLRLIGVENGWTMKPAQQQLREKIQWLHKAGLQTIFRRIS